MRKVIYPLIAAAVAATAVAIIARPGLGQAPEGPRAADAAPVPYHPTMGDLIDLLIQPRHVKLWLAGKQENWPLAGYALKEIGSPLPASRRACRSTMARRSPT